MISPKHMYTPVLLMDSMHVYVTYSQRRDKKLRGEHEKNMKEENKRGVEMMQI